MARSSSSAALALVEAPPNAAPAGGAPAREDAHVLLQAALEAIREPAFVVRAGELGVECNRAGERLLERSPELTSQQLEQIRQGAASPPGVRVTRIDGSQAVLVLIPGALNEALAARAAELWGLSRRQQQVVAMLAEGRSNRAMAAILEVTERTVEQHLSALYERLQLDGRTELMAALLRV